MNTTYLRAKSAAVTAQTTSYFNAEDWDVNVQENDFDDELRSWVVVDPDSVIHDFDTEAEACEFQRHYRAACGQDPMTGIPLDQGDTQ